MSEAEEVKKIFDYWNHRLGSELQGACAVIAMEIFMTLDCDNLCIIGGYLTSSTGWKRAHWWIEKNGNTYDPIGDEYQNEPGFMRVAEHRGHWKDFVAEYRRQKGMIPRPPEKL